MLLRALIRHSPLIVLLFGATTILSAGRPTKPQPLPETFGPIDAVAARIYSDVVLNYASYAPWATTAATVNPRIRLSRGMSAGDRFAAAALSESIARHDWHARRMHAAMAVQTASAQTGSLTSPGMPSEGGQAQLRRDHAAPSARRATSGGGTELFSPVSSTTGTETAQPAPDIALPEGVTIVSPVDAINNAVKSLNEVDAALKQAIAAGG